MLGGFRLTEGRSGQMWFFIGVIVVIVLFALWFRRTNLYRNRNSGRPGDFGGGHGGGPGQVKSAEVVYEG
jgi:hypothetical protein